MKLPISRWAPRLTLFSCIITLGGCADMLPFAGFGGTLALGPFQHYVRNLPVQRVVKQVECELREFLIEHEEKIRERTNRQLRPYKLSLDPEQAASVTLNLQTEEAGGVTYTGVDLSKIGFTALADLISATSAKVPSLQAKANIKGTVSAQLDLAIPQTIQDHIIPEKKKPMPDRKTTYSEPEKKQAKADDRYIYALPPRVCPQNFLELVVRYPTHLYLKEWLHSFFDGYGDIPETDQSCLARLTLKTSFQLAVGLSAGANLATVPLIVLPISGLNVSYDPAFTHSLQITFALAKNNNRALCKSAPQPNTGVR